MSEYKIGEFRANMKKAFDEASRGDSVCIDRYGEDFILITKKDWNDTMALKCDYGISTLITDEASSNVRPDYPKHYCNVCGCNKHLPEKIKTDSQSEK